MILRPAVEADYADVIDLANLAYRGREGEIASWNVESGILEGDRLNDSLLREGLEAKKDGALLVWRETPDGPLLGTAWMNPLGDGVWYLGLLTVHPGRQKGGAGRAVLAAAEDWVRERGGTKVRMTVLSPRKALMEWYERRGYRKTGETEPFPYDDPRIGRPLVPGLHFVVMDRVLRGRREASRA
ncbi:MAG: GNAT family N-acetyltransferase [Acidobacteriaceae bacterium]